MPETANDRFERIARAFEKLTGFLAPGKDDPILREEDNALRSLLWKVFTAGVRHGESR